MSERPKLPGADENVVLVHIDENGDVAYRLAGKCRLFVIDERTPNDRVYEVTTTISMQAINKIIADGEIGDQHDEQHQAVEAAILSKGRLN